MKKNLFSMSLILMLFSFISSNLVTTEAQVLSEKKIAKLAKTEAKQMKKQGWMVNPGTLPMVQQLQNAYTKRYELDQDGYPKYIVGEGKSVAEAYDAAKLQANERAKQEIASKTQTELVSEINSTVGNEQLSPEEAASVVEVIEASKSVIVQSIGRIIPLMETHRVLANKNIEVLVQVAYDSENIKKAAKRAIRDEMKKRGNDMHKKLDEYGFGK